jgi:hypothetical protein
VSANFTTAAYNVNYNTTEPFFCQEKARLTERHGLFIVHLKKVLFLSAVSCYNEIDTTFESLQRRAAVYRSAGVLPAGVSGRENQKERRIECWI